MFYDFIHISGLTSSKEATLKAVKLSQSKMRYPNLWGLPVQAFFVQVSFESWKSCCVLKFLRGARPAFPFFSMNHSSRGLFPENEPARKYVKK